MLKQKVIRELVFPSFKANPLHPLSLHLQLLMPTPPLLLVRQENLVFDSQVAAVQKAVLEKQEAEVDPGAMARVQC
jgi:hypothetical protein